MESTIHIVSPCSSGDRRNSMLTYLNLTLSELNDYFNYDRENGRVYFRRSGKLVTSCSGNSLVANVRRGDKLTKVYMGKMCYFMIHQVPVDGGDKVTYKDGCCENLKPDNLVMVRYVAPEDQTPRPAVVEVDRRIYFSPAEGYYFLRRGKNQATYCSFDLKEVISVRDEWEKDKTIHRWDKFVGKYADLL